MWTAEFVTALGYLSALNDSVSLDTPIAGGQIGIQHQFGQIVVGVEGVRRVQPTTTTIPTTALSQPGHHLRQAGSTTSLSVGPRLGYAMGKWMPYITGGYASAHIAHKSFDNGTGTNPLVLRTPVRVAGTSAAVSTWLWRTAGPLALSTATMTSVTISFRRSLLQVSAVGRVRNVDATVDTLALRVSWKLGRPDRVVPLK